MKNSMRQRDGATVLNMVKQVELKYLQSMKEMVKKVQLKVIR